MNLYFVVATPRVMSAPANRPEHKYQVLMLTCFGKDGIPVVRNDAVVSKTGLMSEMELIHVIQSEGKNAVDNAAIVNGRIQGSPASFDRFKLATHKNDPKQKRSTLVLLGRIVNFAGDVIGYKVADCKGLIKNFDIATTKLWIKQAQNFMVGNKPMPPFQNVIVRGEDKMGNPIIVPYKDQVIMDFGTNVGEMQRAAVVDNKKPMTKRDTNTVTKKVSAFKPECKKLIQQAQASGLNVKVLMNPQLSEAQLKVLIKAMRRGIDVQKFANPDITPKYMDFCMWVEKLGVDCRFLVNENLNDAQKSEVILGIIAGVDVTKYAKRNISYREMAQTRTRMRDAFWSKNSFRVTDDDTLVEFEKSLN